MHFILLCFQYGVLQVFNPWQQPMPLFSNSPDITTHEHQAQNKHEQPTQYVYQLHANMRTKALLSSIGLSNSLQQAGYRFRNRQQIFYLTHDFSLQFWTRINQFWQLSCSWIHTKLTSIRYLYFFFTDWPIRKVSLRSSSPHDLCPNPRPRVDFSTKLHFAVV